MALVIKEQADCGTWLGIWRMDEDIDLLLDVFPLVPDEISQFNQITNKQRKKEWITARILLTELAERRISVTYTSNGKPMVAHGQGNISISHSREFVACLFSNFKQVGIDIETLNNRAMKVRHKYLTDSEQSWCMNYFEHTLVWSAKEAVFKHYEKELDFQQMNVNKPKVVEEQGRLMVEVLKDGKFSNHLCQYRVIENQVVAMVIENNCINCP